MRSVFLQYSLHKSTNIREQIEQLNKLLNIVFQVYGELISYLKYKEDITFTCSQENLYLAPDKTLELHFPILQFFIIHRNN